MQSFLTVISQISFIACLQLVLEIVIDKKENPFMDKVLSIACYLGALYILLHFVYNVLIKEMLYVFRFTF